MPMSDQDSHGARGGSQGAEVRWSEAGQAHTFSCFEWPRYWKVGSGGANCQLDILNAAFMPRNNHRQHIYAIADEDLGRNSKLDQAVHHEPLVHGDGRPAL